MSPHDLRKLLPHASGTKIGDQIRVCYNASSYHPAYVGPPHTVTGFRGPKAIYTRNGWPFYAKSWVIFRG